MSGIDKNVLPFSLVIGNRAILRGLNLVGIRRNKFSKEDISRINEIHKAFISGYKDFDEKNLPIGPFAEISLFFSKVK